MPPNPPPVVAATVVFARPPLFTVRPPVKVFLTVNTTAFADTTTSPEPEIAFAIVAGAAISNAAVASLSTTGALIIGAPPETDEAYFTVTLAGTLTCVALMRHEPAKVSVAALSLVLAIVIVPNAISLSTLIVASPEMEIVISSPLPVGRSSQLEELVIAVVVSAAGENVYVPVVAFGVASTI